MELKENVKGPTGPKGKRGPVGACPYCGSKQVTWDAKNDICHCPECGWHNGGCIMPAALPVRQTPVKLDRSRWEGCEHCRAGFREICFHFGEYVWCKDPDCDDTCEYFKKSSFCKNCGKPLTEEAWAELERRVGESDDRN